MSDCVIYRYNDNKIQFYSLGSWVAINEKKSWMQYINAAQLIGKSGMTGKWHTMSAADYDEIAITLMQEVVK